MEVLHEAVYRARDAAGTVVTIGAYDGVHLGHRAVIDLVRTLAGQRGLHTAVVTFDQHPARIVRPQSAPLLLCDRDQKLELLATTGVDVTLEVHFDRAASEESAEDFVRRVLVGYLSARVVVVGEDFHFGHGRKGNVELLRLMGTGLGFETVGLSLLSNGAEPVSSTRIRELLLRGAVAEASQLLGRPHELRGAIVRGDGRGGSELGFPTANLDVPDGILIPGPGIYAGWYLRPDGATHVAAVSVGRRPTFYEDGSGPLLVEAHLLDFSGDLYGEKGRVRFVSRLRGEERFASVEALVAQMGRDVDATRTLLAG